MPQRTIFGLITATTILAVSIIIGAVIIVVYNSSEDTITILGLLLAFITATISSMYAAFKTSQTSKHVEGLTFSIDGRLTELLETTRKAAYHEGVNVGKSECPDVIAEKIVEKIKEK